MGSVIRSDDRDSRAFREIEKLVKMIEKLTADMDGLKVKLDRLNFTPMLYPTVIDSADHNLGKIYNNL